MTEARKKKRAAEAKGRRLQLLARDYFAAQGCRVEVAPKKVVWVKLPSGAMTPIQTRHDYFGLWDLLIVTRGGARGFCQVTTLPNVASKRSAIKLEGFPANTEDSILGHVAGRRFRILRGPAFPLTPEVVEAPRRAKGGKRGRPKERKVWNGGR